MGRDPKLGLLYLYGVVNGESLRSPGIKWTDEQVLSDGYQQQHYATQRFSLSKIKNVVVNKLASPS